MMRQSAASHIIFITLFSASAQHCCAFKSFSRNFLDAFGRHLMLENILNLEERKDLISRI
jgi:hypothetical protein